MQAKSLAIPCLVHQHLSRPRCRRPGTAHSLGSVSAGCHGNGIAGVSLGRAIPSCDMTEVSRQQGVILKWLILTKSVRVTARPSFSKDPAACRGRPPCEFNHWHPASIASLWGQHTSSGRCHLFPKPVEIKEAQVFSSWPNAELSTKTSPYRRWLAEGKWTALCQILGKKQFPWLLSIQKITVQINLQMPNSLIQPQC